MNNEVAARLLSGGSVLYLGAAFGGMAFLLGRPLYRRLTLAEGRGWEDGIFSAGLGVGAMAGGVFALGVLGLWSSGVLVAASLAALGWGMYANRDLRDRRSARASAALPRSDTAGDRVLAVSLGVVFLFWIPFLLSPEVFYDSLTNHLLLPWQWLRAGRFAPLPFNCTSAFPSNTELLYLLSLAFSDDRLAKTVHYLLAAGTAVAFTTVGNRFFSRRAGLLGALLFFTLPVQGLEFGTTAVEFASTFFVFLSLGALLRAFESAPSSEDRRWLLLAGVFSGLAAGTKYTLWIFPGAVGLALAVFPAAMKRPRGEVLRRWAVCFLAPSALLAAPWAVKNIVLFGNPIYPFLLRWFSPSSAAFENTGFFYSYAVRLAPASPGAAFLRSLVLGPFSPENQLGVFWIAALVFLAALPFLARRFPGRFVAGLFLIQWGVYGVVVHLIRYRIPTLALGSLMAGAVVDLVPRRLRGALTAGLAVLAAANFFPLARKAVAAEGWKVGFGLMSKNEFLNHTRVLYAAPPFPALRFLNKETEATARILVVGEARVYGLERESLSATVFDRHPVRALLAECPNGDEAYRRFRQAGLTHLFVNLAEGSRLRGQWPAWSAADRGVFLDFMTRHCSLVFEDRNFERADFRHTLVYRLVDAIPSEAGTEETARLLMGFFAGPTTPALPGARR